jgi:hypothetical protein
MNKVKFHACHKFGNYAGQCLNKKKGGNGTQSKVVVLAKAHVDEFSKKFEYEFLLVSHLSLGTISVGAWLLDNGATCHMTEARKMFESFIDSNSNVHVELGVGTKYNKGI